MIPEKSKLPRCVSEVTRSLPASTNAHAAAFGHDSDYLDAPHRRRVGDVFAEGSFLTDGGRGMARQFRLAIVIACSMTTTMAMAADAPPLLVEHAAPTDFVLVDAQHAASIVVDAKDFTVAQIATGLLADDVERVTGKRPKVSHDSKTLTGPAVIVGTIGHDAAIDALIADGTLDVSKVRDKWESFVITTVEHPMPNVDRALVIAGSDRRGTAYGALELSEQIGVSPWYWWADVTPTHRDTLAIKSGTNIVGPPTVKYRGIFINDEDWGLQPWAAKNFEKELGNIGPKTYAKVFELLLRLKANYLWPAMHECSTEFGKIDANIKLAEDWGIVMGASHAEPMNRNNIKWRDEKRGEWRLDTNREAVDKYWEEWAQQRGKYEAVWTVGMRGIHDSPMIGPADMPSRVKILENAIADQRTLLAKYVNPKVEEVPQAFMPYKEALTQYQAGLNVPDDVTLVWCEDNFGYLRQVSTPDEQKRSGGSGIYYHISYLGVPKPYLWINTTPPALIWEQMQTALQYGADRIWVLNVGDIKPGEVGIDFWMKLAWNAKRYSVNAQDEFLKEWAAEQFGPEHAEDVAAVMSDFYQLDAQRKPELMAKSVFSVDPSNDESMRRVARFRQLSIDAEQLFWTLPEDKRDAFVELVRYPLHVAALTNKAFFDIDSASANVGRGFWMRDLFPQHDLEQETDEYNAKIAGGKWNGIMTFAGLNRGNRPDQMLQFPKPPAFEGVQGDYKEKYHIPEMSKLEPVNCVYAEQSGSVSMEAEHFTRFVGDEKASWLVVPHLGRTGDAVTIWPMTAPSLKDVAAVQASAPRLEYEFTTTSSGPAKVIAYCLPSYRLHDGRGLRYAISVDDAAPTIVDFNEAGGGSGEAGKNWNDRKTRNVAVTSSDVTIDKPGDHTLKLWGVDPGVIVDKLVIDLGGVKPSELGPPETLLAK